MVLFTSARLEQIRCLTPVNMCCNGVDFAELMSDESHRAFTTFVERWNSGRLSSKYYRGMTALPMRRTNHKWNFTDEVPSKQNTGASGVRTSWEDEQNRCSMAVWIQKN